MNREIVTLLLCKYISVRLPFTKLLLCAMFYIQFNSHDNHQRRHYYGYFIEEETETWKV